MRTGRCPRRFAARADWSCVPCGNCTAGAPGMTDPRLKLLVVTTPEEWKAFHCIRRTVLFEPNGYEYDENHPDDRCPGNVPMLLKRDSRYIGTMRVDLLPDSKAAVIRTVGVSLRSRAVAMVAQSSRWQSSTPGIGDVTRRGSSPQHGRSGSMRSVDMRKAPGILSMSRRTGSR